MIDLATAQSALDSLKSQGFTFFLSFYGGKYHITLNKHAYSGDNTTEVTVKGSGEELTEAVANALANFPKNPLDGSSRWASDRLTGPVEDATFTETSS